MKCEKKKGVKGDSQQLDAVYCDGKAQEKESFRINDDREFNFSCIKIQMPVENPSEGDK